jgi:uncharacterized protein
LALFGSVSRVGQVGITVAIWALQLWLSPLWLDRFRFGPMEWLWRSLSCFMPGSTTATLPVVLQDTML